MKYKIDDSFMLKVTGPGSNNCYINSSGELVYVYCHPLYITNAVVSFKFNNNNPNDFSMNISGIRTADDTIIIPKAVSPDTAYYDYCNINEQRKMFISDAIDRVHATYKLLGNKTVSLVKFVNDVVNKSCSCEVDVLEVLRDREDINIDMKNRKVTKGK